jgi:tetratricopeptide (TPR) repeat protein
MFLRIVVMLLLTVGISVADELSFALSPAQNELAEKVTQKTMELNYVEAFNLARKLRLENDGVGCVFQNIIRVSMYDDKGDTTSLKVAAKNLETCKTEGLWDALRNFEIGYVLTETGHSVKGAMQTRSAASQFEDAKDYESKAFYAIYAYYVDNSFGWLPFKSDNREAYLKILDSGSLRSARFWPLFLTPLIWMHYDRKDYKTGLSLAERGLKKAPNHPVMLQIKADMLYRLERYDEAATIYEKSAADYLERTGKSIRYWCSILNLIRIYHDAGDDAKSQEQRKKLNDPDYQKMKKWMPGSLIDDLTDRKLI